mmetsp:Transcript_3985/g.4067  ORF Transcript_3985/g.4067 Transcript_3985/m.4067 type:complete len:199 (-) Transcript_3985:76-672(-)
MGACLDCFKKGEKLNDNEAEMSQTANRAVMCKVGLYGPDVKVKDNPKRNSYLLEGTGIMLGSCMLDCDTAFWEVVVGKNPEGLKIGIKRFNAKKKTPLTGELDSKAEDAWYLENFKYQEGDVIGVCWDQTDLPMVSFCHNGELVGTGAINRIRPSIDLFPAVSLANGATCEVIYNGDNFIKAPPSNKFKMIVCASSLI